MPACSLCQISRRLTPIHLSRQNTLLGTIVALTAHTDQNRTLSSTAPENAKSPRRKQGASSSLSGMSVRPVYLTPSPYLVFRT